MGAELQSLKHAAVGGVDLANGPAWLSDYAEHLSSWKDYAAANWPDHTCPKCIKKGYKRWLTNYDYQPTPEEMEDPVYWCVFPSEVDCPPVMGMASIPRTTWMVRSLYEKEKTHDSFVFYKTYFRPCVHSFDFISLSSLQQWQIKKLGRVEIIVSHLSKTGFTYESVSNHKNRIVGRAAVSVFLEESEDSYRLRKSYGNGLFGLPGLGILREEHLKPVKAAILAADELCEAGLNDQEHARKHYGLDDIKFNWLAPEEITIINGKL